MSCEQWQEQIADYLAGSLSAAAAAELDAHFAQCAACKQEAETLAGTWRMLGLLDREQPSAALRPRFYQTLDAYKQGAASAAPTPIHAPRRVFDLDMRWLAAAAMLIVGVAVGRWSGSRGDGQTDIAQLQNEVHNMRQMVTLSLLQQQSASERLRGVDYANRVEPSNPQVLQALLEAVSHDQNVNVRLAAVDALRKFANAPEVRDTLGVTLAKQDSPMVQIALIDLIVDMRVKSAAPSLEALERDAAANKSVQQRAVWGLSQLQ